MNYDAQRYDAKARALSTAQRQVIAKLEDLIANYESFDQRWAGTKLERQLFQYVHAANQPMRLCDWGCYTGKLAIYLSARLPQLQVYGIDISQDALAVAARLNDQLSASAIFIRADLGASELCLKSGSSDFIVGFGVLHHLPHAQAYRNIAQALKPGGRALFLEPTKLNPFVRIYRHLRNEAYSPNEIPVDFETIAEIKRAVPNCDVTYSAEHLLSTPAMLFFRIATKAPFGLLRWFFNRQYDRRAIALCGRLDDLLLRKIPFLQRYAQYFIITIHRH
jgi:SAM-dependent methyltransferase